VALPQHRLAERGGADRLRPYPRLAGRDAQRYRRRGRRWAASVWVYDGCRAGQRLGSTLARLVRGVVDLERRHAA
jgi:hypothetical protein